MSGSIATATAAETQTGARAAPRINADFNTFLTLLTTQLRNQDPTNAMDAQQMTSQLVQFSSVEQQLAMNQNLDRLISLQQGSQLVSATPLTGRLVEVESDRLSLQGGVATLRLPPAVTGAARARVDILDGTGRVLRGTEVTLTGTQQDWRWDGRDTGGRLLADGAYSVRVTAPPAAGAPATTLGPALPFTVVGRATGAERAEGEVRLRLGQLAVNFDRLRGVTE